MSYSTSTNADSNQLNKLRTTGRPSLLLSTALVDDAVDRIALTDSGFTAPTSATSARVLTAACL